MFLIANTFAICFNKDYLLTYLLTVMKVANRCHTDLFIHLGRSAAAHNRSMVVSGVMVFPGMFGT